MCSAAAAFLAADRLPPATAARLWRADQLARSMPGLDEGGGPGGRSLLQRSTGHAALDAELPGGGWPAAGLTELLLSAPGSGELSLLAPALAGRTWLCVAPPCRPCVPALAALGLAPELLTVAQPDNAADAAWAAEQALRSGALAAVLWWQPHFAGAPRHAATLPTTLRRLHLAALEGRTPLFALRPTEVGAHSSPAPLRLTVAPAGGRQLRVQVFKRRGPPMAAPLLLTLPGGSLAQRARRLAAGALTSHALVRPLPAAVAA
jgi:protein ImuA